jgi:hypothetical protein
MQKIKQKLNKLLSQAKFEKNAYFSGYSQRFKAVLENLKKDVEPGGLNEHQVKTLALICLIAFTGYIVLFKQNYYKNFVPKENHSEEKSPRDIKKEKLKKELAVLVEGHPIEMMIPYIVRKDQKTVAYLIGIAKKESNWGKRHPVLAGVDCYNYWGFRAKQDRMGSGGHTCFDNPREAVDVVSKRITEIIDRNEAESAKDLLVWKCGSDCSITGGQAAADKWVEDVDFYAEKLLN